jgi:hypothetical protein
MPDLKTIGDNAMKEDKVNSKIWKVERKTGVLPKPSTPRPINSPPPQKPVSNPPQKADKNN